MRPLDLFALAALQGMLAHSTRYRVRPGSPADLRGANWHEAIADEAYELAAEMLKRSEAGRVIDEPQVVGRVHVHPALGRVAFLNSVGGVLPEGAPLYSEPPARKATA